MSKFLKVIEENTPNSIETTTHELIRDLVSLIDTIDGIKVTTQYPDKIRIQVNSDTILLRLEDIFEGGIKESNEYNIDSEVENLASKAMSGPLGLFGKLFGTSAQKAKKAVKDRQKLAVDAIGAYERVTRRLGDTLRKLKSDPRYTTSTSVTGQSYNIT